MAANRAAVPGQVAVSLSTISRVTAEGAGVKSPVGLRGDADSLATVSTATAGWAVTASCISSPSVIRSAVAVRALGPALRPLK